MQAQFADHQWTELSLAPRHFAWRIRGNPLSWAYRYRELLEKKYDLILATSMVDLACLRGLVPGLAHTPAILYFHENQFAYPLTAKANSMLEAQMVNLYSALSAQKIVFNSQYNRESFLQGVDDLLRKLPDEVPENLVEILQSKSSCLPVPLVASPPAKERARQNEERGQDTRAVMSESPVRQLVWNHRWEYDKGPERLLALIQKLDSRLSLRFHIVGQQFREQPPVFSEIRELLNQRAWLGTWGYVEDRERYTRLLEEADFVLSTALHDFQGLAVLEAVTQGCLPIVPDRLAYPEYFQQAFRYRSCIDDLEAEALGATSLIEKYIRLLDGGEALPEVTVAQWQWSHLAGPYRELFESTAGLEVSCASTKNHES